MERKLLNPKLIFPYNNKIFSNMTNYFNELLRVARKYSSNQIMVTDFFIRHVESYFFDYIAEFSKYVDLYTFSLESFARHLMMHWRKTQNKLNYNSQKHYHRLHSIVFYCSCFSCKAAFKYTQARWPHHLLQDPVFIQNARVNQKCYTKISKYPNTVITTRRSE